MIHNYKSTEIKLIDCYAIDIYIASAEKVITANRTALGKCKIGKREQIEC